MTGDAPGSGSGGSPAGTGSGSPGAEGGPAPGTTLRRRLGAVSGAGIIVGLMVGSGIFRVPSVVAGHLESVVPVTALWILGGALALLGALSLAELATMFPWTGGLYVYLREVYGPLLAFLYGWTRLLVLAPASIGAIALICAAYLRSLLPVGGATESEVAVAVIALVALLNYRSVPASAATGNALSAVKVAGLVLLGLALLWLGDVSAGSFAGAGTRGPPASLSAFGLGLVTVMWTYSGWTSVTALGGEMRDPGRSLPRALVLGTAVVMGAYLVVNAGYLWVLPSDAIAASPLVAADAAEAAAGLPARRLVAVLVAVSTFGALHAAMMYNPRIFYAMADDGLLFGAFGRAHRRYGTPHLAVTLCAVLGVGYVLSRSFEQLAETFILGLWPFHVLAVAGLFLLRRRRPDADRPYRVWGYPLTPALFLLGSVAMVGNAVWRRPVSGAVSLAAVLLGVPVYALWLRSRG